MKVIYTTLSFMSTPLSAISGKAGEIEGLGWYVERALPDLWAIVLSKEFPEGTSRIEADEELKSVMGEYWAEQ